MEIGDRVLVFHWPARIAYETRLDAAMSEQAREAVHKEIMRVLSALEPHPRIRNKFFGWRLVFVAHHTPRGRKKAAIAT